MNHIFKSRTKGRVLYIKGSQLYKSINDQIVCSVDGGESWRDFYRLKTETFFDKIIYRNHLASRLLRKGIHHLDAHSGMACGVLFDKKIGILKNGKLTNDGPIKGSRPLSFENIEGELIFGEYRSNPERSGISVYGMDLSHGLYTKWQMTGIRHIHGIYQDPYTESVWITTGDDDNEAAIFNTDTNFSEVKRVLFGSQQTRTIKLLFDEKFVYFGSDAPHEVNYLYRMDKSTHEVQKLAEVGSSVFHGCKVGNWFFFSTAIEPSRVNKTQYSEVWASPDGSNWSCILRFKKDPLPMKYFQYGQVFFPAGYGNDQDLWLSPFATEYSNMSFKIGLDKVHKLYNKIL